MRSFVVICAAAALLLGCDASTGVDLSEQGALSMNQARWDKAGVHDYSFDYTEQKFGITYRKRITVLDDTVAGVLDIGSEPPGAPEQSWPTIDDLFATAREDLGAGNLDVSIHYDARLGFPTDLAAESRSLNPGGGFHASVANLNTLPIEIPVR